MTAATNAVRTTGLVVGLLLLMAAIYSYDFPGADCLAHPTLLVPRGPECDASLAFPAAPAPTLSPASPALAGLLGGPIGPHYGCSRVSAAGAGGAGLPPGLPREPFQRCATKALAGWYGKLADWQAEGYLQGLQRGVFADRPLVLTQYNAGERGGQRDRRGRPCTSRTAAATSIPYGAWVWTPLTGIRQVLDTGARTNDRTARAVALSRGVQDAHEAVWVDIWYPTVAHARRAGLTGWHPVRGAVVLGR